MYTYDTVSAATTGLRERGYTLDFNLHENCLICHEDKFNPDDFEIMEVYRFEGNSDPADEAVVYAIESKTGLKGVLVNGFGISANAMSSDMVKKLSLHYS
ncbi:MAG: phosphoribosylpyrophosphate synthetase [Chitinophagaceae bacterium]